MTAANGSSNPLQVGAAAVEVSVPPGTMMSGFAARVEPSVGVHDALTVRALVIDDFCWVTVDVCGLDEATCRTIADRIPFRKGHAVISATHTHAGPCATPGRLGNCDTEILEAITAAAVTAAENAANARVPSDAYYESFSGLGIARDRRRPERAIDPALQVVVFKRYDGTVNAWLVQYPCHPVVLGADNLLVSGDYPAFVRSHLERAAPGSTAVFLTGAAGDVNTGHSAESSYSRTSAQHRTFAEAERIGSLLGEAAAKGRESTRPLGSANLAATASVELCFEVLDARSPEESAAHWTKLMVDAPPGQRALLQNWIDWAALDHTLTDMKWTGTVTVLQLGSLLLVALPGEPFLACAERIQEAFATPVVVAAYSNGCPGYFPTSDEYDHGGYEVTDAHRYYGMPAPFKRGSAEQLVATAIDLGRGLL
ncbi:neutral/alkaline non-lysosomal ceramidase N-terminal domain-containing protein [Pseudarthrobacter sp. SSS035]|uniref:neutral/alkaline non-lysosomal ceramidase N-terminal domain-containing protein n=1 Tax=Pseudarthrobacter sp. SSS035 TaxID=2931399 RepID=UPI00200E4FA4|nr:neutral/alkaline non-lysosomal ceramidase N-terminal domain-containing protein [Pseudarthrobacter sp. SSS035]